MSEIATTNERIPEVKVTFNETGEEYILDFSRKTAAFAQARGFDPEHLFAKCTTEIPNLFYYAMQKNHGNLGRNQVDKLREKLFPLGLPQMLIERLVELYLQAATVEVITTDEEYEKNAVTTVEM